MSKLTDIKNRIDQLGGGDFQNLCDAYLTFKGYKNAYSLGMLTGTDKPAPGSPDTYFLNKENQYIFVMYTTQKTEFLQKALEDIDKCFDIEKTGISPSNIVEIIYCHTYGRLKPGDDQTLRQHCEQYGAVLKLIGLDELGNDIFSKYPILARDFLGISIDSGQILPLDIFVEQHDANKMSAPLDTEFILREDDLEKAKSALYTNDILLISGSAGVGKTRFALELCRQLEKEFGYTVLVIKNNNLQIYDDLVSVIEEKKDYLVLVDDANELSSLHHILDYLPKAPNKSKFISKIILTVRDYAKKQVIQTVMEYDKPEIIKITKFNDEDIKKLVESSYGIRNQAYKDRIVIIAEGNARLAMLAGKLAVNSGTIDSIKNAYDLYHTYYNKQLNNIIESKTGLSSAGIISFIQAIHLEHLEKLTPIFEAFRITSDKFISDIKLLHEAEIVDLCNNKAARISDQSFSNFLIEYVFIEKKIIPLSTMIENGFQFNKTRTIDACLIIWNIFSEPNIKKYLEEQINIVWDKLKDNSELFLPFFKAFHMLRPTETLIWLNQQILQEPSHQCDVRTLLLKNKLNNKNISDDILQILSNFATHSDLPIALELILLYYKKRPDLFEQFYNIYTDRFEFTKYSSSQKYFTQTEVVKSLCIAVDSSLNDINLLNLFVCVAKHFLKFNFSKAECLRHKTISFYNLTLNPDTPVLEYRKMLLSKLYQIYQSGSMHAEIEQLLYNYNIAHHTTNPSLEIVKAEFEDILNFFTLLQPENLFHCLIAEHIKQVADFISYNKLDILSPFLNSEKYKICSTLSINYFEDYANGHEEGVQRHKNKIRKLIEKYTTANIDFLIQVCAESNKAFENNYINLSSGLEYVLEAFETNQQLYVYFIESYLKANTPYNLYAGSILIKLFEILPVSEVKILVTKYKYNQKNTWLWFFYAFLPDEHITIQITQDLLHYLDTPDTELNTSPYRNILCLCKYEKVDSKIVYKALRIISDYYDKYPFIFHYYAYQLLSTNNKQEAIKILRYFSNELQLLEEIYLKEIFYYNYTDYTGALFLEIISTDNLFIYNFLEGLINLQTDKYIDDSQYTTYFLKIWNIENYIDLADNIFDYCYNKRTQLRFLSPIKLMLQKTTAISQEIITKQDIWINHIIEKYCYDKEKMYQLFCEISELPCERRKTAIKKFLFLNSDPSAFEQLPLEPNHYGGSGSMIPYMQERIDYLQSLLPLVSGLKYLEQKQRIEREINCWKEEINFQEVHELLEFWYD